MAKATPFKLSPLGRELYAEMRHALLLANLAPASGNLSDELMDDERYRRAWDRAHDKTWNRIDALIAQVVVRPVSVATLPEYTLAAARHIAPGAHTHESVIKLIDGVMRMSSLEPWPLQDWKVGTLPPDAEAVIRKLLGKHRPKRNPLSAEDERRIADEAARAAVVAAKAKAKASMKDAAPFFAQAA